MKFILSHYIWLTIICLDGVQAAPPTCLDPDGKPVDWFTVYKLPKVKVPSWPESKSGTALVYLDANKPGSWRRLDSVIDDVRNPVALSIAPIYDKNSTTMFALYNDQPPPFRLSPYKCGHAKGVLIFNEEGGIWLVHSVPSFPSRPNVDGKYSYPSTGHRNGQSALCLTLPVSELEKIAKQLHYSDVYFYDKNIPKSYLTSSRPYLALLDAPYNTKQPPAPYSSTMQLTTSNGYSFTSFSKHKKFGKDLYFDQVAPELGTGLLVEAWRIGFRNVASDCSGNFPVMNVQSIQFDTPADLDVKVSFDTLHDHSKWAVSTDASNPWTCIGDVNRQYRQYGRGGGTVCHRNKDMWQAYRNLILDIEDCTETKSQS